MVKDIIKKELCIVHIGMPKTGSSALQESLFNNIIDTRVSYANLPDSNHSGIIFSMFANHPQSHGIHRGRTIIQIEDYNKKNKELLVKGFLSNNSDIEIISGEDIFHIDEHGLRRMKDFLEKYFKNILIVGYIRSPKSFMSSAFQQLVKFHKLDSFNFSVIYPHYKIKLEKFDKVFNRENVYLWKFDPANFPNNDITLDFCNRLNIETDSKLAIRSNDSISQEAISILFANNIYGKELFIGMDSMRIQNKLVEKISKIGTNKFVFSKTLISNILDQYKDDIKWIENRMSISLQEYSNELKSDINSEDELLIFSNETIIELKALIGIDYLKEESISDSPQDVAKLVDILKLKIADELGIKEKNITLNNKIITSEQEINEYNILRDFDIEWKDYYKDNKIADLSTDPISHYINNWSEKNLVIGNIFNTFFYLEKYPDIKKANINPLIHYFRHGIKEGRKGIEKK